MNIGAVIGCVQLKGDLCRVSAMAGFFSAAVDKIRSDMVDVYLRSYFRHKRANAIVILRDGITGPERVNIRGMEIMEDGIFLRFGPSNPSGASGFSRVESARSSRSSGVVSADGGLGDEEEVGARGGREDGRYSLHGSRYSLDTVVDGVAANGSSVLSGEEEDGAAGGDGASEMETEF